MVEFVSIILIGLTDGVSDDPARHQRAITSIKMALRGDLLTPPPPRASTTVTALGLRRPDVDVVRCRTEPHDRRG